MAHSLVLQLRFTRSEFKRAAAGISEEDARERVAVRKILGHTGRGVFVGDIDHEAPYTPGGDG
jgi:hypothetical protein